MRGRRAARGFALVRFESARADPEARTRQSSAALRARRGGFEVDPPDEAANPSSSSRACVEEVVGLLEGLTPGPSPMPPYKSSSTPPPGSFAPDVAGLPAPASPARGPPR